MSSNILNYLIERTTSVAFAQKFMTFCFSTSDQFAPCGVTLRPIMFKVSVEYTARRGMIVAGGRLCRYLNGKNVHKWV